MRLLQKRLWRIMSLYNTNDNLSESRPHQCMLFFIHKRLIQIFQVESFNGFMQKYLVHSKIYERQLLEYDFLIIFYV